MQSGERRCVMTLIMAVNETTFKGGSSTTVYYQIKYVACGIEITLKYFHGKTTSKRKEVKPEFSSRLTIIAF